MGLDQVWVSNRSRHVGAGWDDSQGERKRQKHKKAHAQRVASELKAAGWHLERMLSDNGNEFRGHDFTETRKAQRPPQPHPRRTPGNVEALQRTVLDECWRPAFARYIYPSYTGLKRELETYLRFYNNDRVHHGRLTRGRIPADIVYGARKMEAK